jgi:hypothetical protein
MKIKKLNENNPFSTNEYDDNDITIEITFSGVKKLKLNDIKYTDYYTEYVDENDYESISNSIFYGIEDYIYNNGLGGYSYKIFDKNGNEIEKEDISRYIDTNKYNL